MKGIAIISVVLGHCSIPFIEGWVNQYHLLVFYFFAGYFFKSSYIEKPLLFIGKRIKRLWLPFIYYGLGALTLHNVFCSIGFYPENDIYIISDFIHHLKVLFLRMRSYEPFVGAMWFLTSLLIASIIYLFIQMLPVKKYKPVIILLCFAIGYIAKDRIPNPFCIWDCMILVPILEIGRLFKEYDVFNRLIDKKIILISLAVMITTYLAGGIVHLQSQALGNVNPFIYIVVCLSGIIMVYGISKLIHPTSIGKLLAICGDYSFEIMALHFISFKLIAPIHSLVCAGDISHLSDFPVYTENLSLWTPAYLIAGVSLPIIIASACAYAKQYLIKHVNAKSQSI